MALKFGTYVEDRARAARWMFDRRDKVTFWRWPVLTVHNSDSEGLRLQDATAYHVFVDLAARGLLLPFVHDDGHEAYRLNLGKESEWGAVIEPPGFVRKFIVPAFSWLFRNVWAFIIWLASVFIAAWIGSWFGK